MGIPSLKLTAKAHENHWPNFGGELLVSGRVFGGVKWFSIAFWQNFSICVGIEFTVYMFISPDCFPYVLPYLYNDAEFMVFPHYRRPKVKIKGITRDSCKERWSTYVVWHLHRGDQCFFTHKVVANWLAAVLYTFEQWPVDPRCLWWGAWLPVIILRTASNLIYSNSYTPMPTL